MRICSIFWFSVASLALLENAFGQVFQDLDFESATLVPVSGTFPVFVQFAPAFPGWNESINSVQTNVVYNALALDSADIAIIDRTSPNFVGNVIDGNYTAVLQSGLGSTAPNNLLPTDVTLYQTGVVPAGTKSLQFKANEWFDSSGTFAVTLGGQTLSLAVLGTGANYTLYGGNVSQWAGQTAQLAFTVFAEIPHQNDETLFLDDIHFSTQSVPEPDVIGLLVMAIVGFAASFRK
jgi:hypothetical protein